MVLRKLLQTAAVSLAVFTSTAAFAEGSGCATPDTTSSTTKPFVCPDVPLLQRHVAPATDSKAVVKAKAKKKSKAKKEDTAPTVEEKK